ncbi:hypothetical protein RZE82_00450 [Mollicutes bacterium LVI A0039]|nr:hypothetical protein RZE82_00450 [Mollicutes bacterium LVI A0039]
MLKEEKKGEIKDYHKMFNVIAGVRVIFLMTAVFSSTIELGLSFSILKIADTASSIVGGLFLATFINIILLFLYMKMVKEKNNQSFFIIYIIEVLSSVYGVLGIYAFFRYIQEIEIITISAVVGMIGLIDLIIINLFVGSYFLQGTLNDRLIEFAIVVNIIILASLLFI